MLGMYPKLVKQIDQRHDAKQNRRHAQQGQRQVKQPPQQTPAGGLAQGGGKVVFLALVVHHMGRPKDSHFMPCPVQPVVAQVIQQQGAQPAIPMVPHIGFWKQGNAIKHPGIGRNTYEFGQHTHDLAEQAQA